MELTSDISLDSWRSYRWAALYVAIIVTVNVLFGWSPAWTLVANVIVGLGFIVRDFAQRDIGRRVLLATALGVAISYWAAPTWKIALASAVAFALSEVADYLVVAALHRRPMWERVAWSHLVTVPLDSALFLGGLALGAVAPWAWFGFGLMVALKFGALLILFVLR